MKFTHTRQKQLFCAVYCYGEHLLPVRTASLPNSNLLLASAPCCLSPARSFPMHLTPGWVHCSPVTQKPPAGPSGHRPPLHQTSPGNSQLEGKERQETWNKQTSPRHHDLDILSHFRTSPEQQPQQMVQKDSTKQHLWRKSIQSSTDISPLSSPAELPRIWTFWLSLELKIQFSTQCYPRSHMLWTSSFTAELTVFSSSQLELFLALHPSPQTCALHGWASQCAHKANSGKMKQIKAFLDTDWNWKVKNS